MGVNKVDTASGEVIMDISDSTVTPETLAEGTTAYNSQGEKIVGTMKSGGGSDSCFFSVDITLDLYTMSIAEISHTYEETLALLETGKPIFLNVNYGIGVAKGQLTAYNTQEEVLLYQVIAQFNFGDGLKLYYFVVEQTSNNVALRIYTITTTGIGG